jgi:hypothetical protein
MTEATVDAHIAHVMAVVKLDRLLDGVLHAAGDWRSHVEEHSANTAHDC